MIQRGKNLRFALEASEAVGIQHVDVGQKLDRDIAAKSRVAGTIHLAHSAFAQQRDNLVRPDAGA